MKKIICWLIGHDWFIVWSAVFRFQEGMETFRQKICLRCGKIIKFDIQKAEKPLPPIDCGQKINWKNYYTSTKGNER